jgi:hypothetical protein
LARGGGEFIVYTTFYPSVIRVVEISWFESVVVVTTPQSVPSLRIAVFDSRCARDQNGGWQKKEG